MISLIPNSQQSPPLDPIEEQAEQATPIPFVMTDTYREDFAKPELAKEIFFRRGYPFPNEKHLDVVFDDIRDIGGTLVGLGGLQNLDLAAIMQAGAIVLVDFSPFTSTYLLSFFEFIRTHNHEEFKDALSATRTISGTQNLLRPDRIEAYGLHPKIVATARISSYYRFCAAQFLTHVTHHHSPFWQEPQAFAHIKNLLGHGKIQLILGDFFTDETRALTEAACAQHDAPVRAVYLSNAPEWICDDPQGDKARTLNTFLTHPTIDQPKGRLLITTEKTTHRQENITKGDHKDSFSYHVEPIHKTQQALHEAKTLPNWTAHFQAKPGLNLDKRCQFPSHKKMTR